MFATVPVMSVLRILAPVPLAAIALLYILSWLFANRYPANLARVGEARGQTRFRLRTRLRYYTNCKELFREAYENYSKKGKTCLIPGLGARDEIILPPSATRWLTAQPDDVLSVPESFRELDQIDYVLGNPKYVLDGWQTLMVKRDMMRILERLMKALNNELEFAFDRRFGTKTEVWTELNLWTTMKLIVAQGSSRFTVNLPFCRNEDYLRDTTKFGDLLVALAGLLGALPRFLRPVVGNIAALPIRYTSWNIKQSFKPVFNERMLFLDRAESEKSPLEPVDQLQMMMQFAKVERPNELTLNEMTNRLIMANFGSTHQTGVAITNIILNILASDPEYDTISIIRDEVTEVLGVTGGHTWSKGNIAKLVRIDSIMRETLRLNSFGNRSVMRKVLVDGIHTEDGILLPKGSSVSLLAYPAQTDEAIFHDPFKFDPFRFSRIRESTTSTTVTSDFSEKDGLESGLAGKNASNLNFVSIGLQNLPFGLGRHACPGRFILDFELKMIVAYLVMNYDFEFPPEYRGKRPESKWIAEAMFPPSWAKIRVKRKTAKWVARVE